MNGSGSGEGNTLAFAFAFAFAFTLDGFGVGSLGGLGILGGFTGRGGVNGEGKDLLMCLIGRKGKVILLFGQGGLDTLGRLVRNGRRDGGDLRKGKGGHVVFVLTLHHATATAFGIGAHGFTLLLGNNHRCGRSRIHRHVPIGFDRFVTTSHHGRSRWNGWRRRRCHTT